MVKDSTILWKEEHENVCRQGKSCSNERHINYNCPEKQKSDYSVLLAEELILRGLQDQAESFNDIDKMKHILQKSIQDGCRVKELRRILD